jgi:hypothetical protein
MVRGDVGSDPIHTDSQKTRKITTMSRMRERETGVYGGGTLIPKYGNPVAVNGGVAKREWMTDNPTGSPPYFDKQADYKSWEINPGRINGSDSRYGRWRYKFENVPFDASALGPASGALLPWNVLVTEALSRIQPEPVVDIPLFLYELREIPKMLKDAGKFLSSPTRTNPGDAYLSYSFGWGPLMRDISALADLAQQFNEQMDRLRDAQRRKRLEGSLMSASGPLPDQGSHSYNYGYLKCDYRVRAKVKHRSWFVAKFKTFDIPPDVDNAGINQVRYALGLKGASPATIWNMIPWTWLMDYFSNVSTYLQATRNVVKYDLETLCVMQRAEITKRTQVERKDFFEGTITPGTSVTTSWERRVYWNAAPSIGLEPFLSSGQIANLGALVISGKGRYK